MEQKIIWSADEETNEIMAVIGSTLQQVQREGFAYCKLCGLKVYGDDIGEILEMLGEHGDADHKEKICMTTPENKESVDTKAREEYINSDREHELTRRLSHDGFEARGLARSRYHTRLFHQGRPRPSNEQFDEGFDAGWNAHASAQQPSEDGLKPAQRNIWRWCEETFDGIAAWRTDKERAYRFFEEAGELFQAVGMTREDALRVVDYVFGRTIGEVSQEIGGVMITLCALASQQNADVQDSMQTEYERITRPEIQEKIRGKQRAKNQAFL